MAMVSLIMPINVEPMSGGISPAATASMTLSALSAGVSVLLYLKLIGSLVALLSGYIFLISMLNAEFDMTAVSVVGLNAAFAMNAKTAFSVSSLLDVGSVPIKPSLRIASSARVSLFLVLRFSG